MSPALATGEFLIGHFPVRVILAHDDIFDDASIAVFVNDFNVVMAAGDAMECERSAAVLDYVVAELIWTPRIFMCRREEELVNVPVRPVHDHELSFLRLRVRRVRQ